MLDGGVREPAQGSGVFEEEERKMSTERSTSEGGSYGLDGRCSRQLALGGRAEIVGEAEAVVEWRVGVEPEDNEAERIGVVEVFFAEDLKEWAATSLALGMKP